MRKVIIYIAMSLDGYVADKNGGVSWLGGDNSDNENFGSYPEFIETIDTVILGYTTYNQIVTELSPEVWPYEGKTSYILTSKSLENKEEIIFTNESLLELLKKLKEEEGKYIWICGGASIVNQVIEENIFDEICISMIPTILGEGVSLFKERLKETKLELISTKTYNGIVDLKYKKREN